VGGCGDREREAQRRRNVWKWSHGAQAPPGR